MGQKNAFQQLAADPSVEACADLHEFAQADIPLKDHQSANTFTGERHRRLGNFFDDIFAALFGALQRREQAARCRLV